MIEAMNNLNNRSYFDIFLIPKKNNMPAPIINNSCIKFSSGLRLMEVYIPDILLPALLAGIRIIFEKKDDNANAMSTKRELVINISTKCRVGLFFINTIIE